MPDLPRGTVTFLFADLAPDAPLWQDPAGTLEVALLNLEQVLGETVTGGNGIVYKHTGHGIQAAFPTATDGLLAAITAQEMLHDPATETPPGTAVRIALHTGAVEPQPDGDYRSPVLNRLGRLLDAGHGGQVLLSHVTAELARDTLPDDVVLRELGEHRLKDLSRPERIIQVTVPGLADSFPPLRSLSTIPNNLRAQPTPLIGRSRELATIANLLNDPGVRVITLLGAGGAGKTRLAMQVGADHLEAFPDGVFFIDLSECTSPIQIPAVIAQVLDIEDDPAQPILESIHAWLSSKLVLLVLDNLEQIEGVGPLVAGLSERNSALHLLATSRTPLRIRGEQEVPIEPLPVPNLRRLPRLEILSQYDSVALFIDRARAVQPAFAVTNETAPAIAEICVRLDGLPLAIELAAARIRLLPPNAMLERLTSRLPLLIDGPRDLPVRHQTLRGAIAWSYDLLTPAEQAIFRRLAVFHGRAGLDAVEAVATDGLDLDALTGLEHLAGHSLVRALSEDDTPAVAMLETIREFGLEMLADTGELDTMRDSHADWFAGLMQEAFPHLLGHDQVEWFDRLAADQDNLAVALRWSIETIPTQAVAMAADLWWFWYVRGQLRTARQLLDEALAAEPATPSIERARALHGSATLAYVMGDAEIARTNGEAALALNRQLGNVRGIPTNLNHLANVALADNPDRAQMLYEECLSVSQQLGDDNVTAVAMLNLGSLATRHSDYSRAEARYREALEIWRKTGDLGSQAVALANLGTIALLADDGVESALEWLDQSLVIARQIGDQVGLLACLAGYATAFSQSGQHEIAARLRGAVDALREAAGELEDSAMADLDRQMLARAQEVLGAERYVFLAREGATWSVDIALAEVEKQRDESNEHPTAG